jgi:hypothetical protein
MPGLFIHMTGSLVWSATALNFTPCTRQQARQGFIIQWLSRIVFGHSSEHPMHRWRAKIQLIARHSTSHLAGDSRAQQTLAQEPVW